MKLPRESLTWPQASPSAMWYQVTLEPAYLRADLHNRKTVAETREFLDAVAADCINHQRRRVLISVHNSLPIFTLEKYGFSSFVQLAEKCSEKIALVADSIEIRMAHEYAGVLARLRGLNLQSFGDDAAAVRWMKDQRYRADRRQRIAPRPLLDRRGRRVPRRSSHNERPSVS